MFLFIYLFIYCLFDYLIMSKTVERLLFVVAIIVAILGVGCAAAGLAV
jgi:hypothetical protein